MAREKVHRIPLTLRREYASLSKNSSLSQDRMSEVCVERKPINSGCATVHKNSLADLISAKPFPPDEVDDF